MAKAINDGLTPQERYDRKTARRVMLKLNKNTDADIIEKLEAQDSMQGYIKKLIREDIAKNGTK
ncbi:MAG: hypothetical protein SOI56_09230 [Eubacteriales bacterium]|jgi:hypothetical protein